MSIIYTVLIRSYYISFPITPSLFKFTTPMAKPLSFIFTPFYKNPKPSFVFKVRNFTMGIENQDQQQLKKIAAEVAEIIRTRPRWESTLLSNFPSLNFIDPNFYNEVLKLQDNAFLNLRFFNWLTSLSGFSPDPISCNSLFVSLVKSKASVVAKSFLDSVPQFSPDPDCLESLICCLFEDGYVDEALDLIAKLKPLGVFCPSIMTWNSALCGAVRVKRTDIVWKLYGEMIDSGVGADVETLGHLIQAFCVENNVERGYELVLQVRDGGVAPSKVALNRLICELSKSGNYGRVSELLHFMIARNQNPDIYTYQGVIYGLCKRRKEVEGYRIFNALKTRGYVPDRVMYTTMIHGLCQMRWLGEARKLWFEVMSKGIIPNEYTYNVLIHGYFTIHALEEAWNLHREMCNRGYKLTTVTYNTLIGGLCKNRKVHEAYSLFEEMAQNGVARDVITYNTLILGVCKQGELAKGMMLLEELVVQGLQPSTSSYSPLIEQLCQVGSTQQALQLWTNMVNKGLEPSICSHECIITGFCKEGLPIEGMQWLSEMLDRKLVPRKGTFETLIQCLSQQDKLDAALFVLQSMLRIGYVFGEIVCSSLVSKLCNDSLDDMETSLQDIISITPSS